MTAIDPSRLSLDRLKTLVVFAETGRVEEAARRLHMTQAGVSLQLKKLEEELGEELFLIVGRKKQLTPLAQELFKSLAPGFRQLEESLQQSGRENLQPESLNLRVGCRSEMWTRLGLDISFPGRLSFKNLSREQSLKALQEDKIDMAVISDPPSSGQIYAKKWLKNGVVWCGSRKFFAGSSVPKTWEELLTKKDLWLKENFAAYKEQPPFVEELGLSHKDLHIKWLIEDWRSLVQVITKFPGWSLVPEDVLSEDNDLLQVSISKIKPQQFYLVYGEHLKKQKRFRELIKIKDINF